MDLRLIRCMGTQLVDEIMSEEEIQNLLEEEELPEGSFLILCSLGHGHGLWLGEAWIDVTKHILGFWEVSTGEVTWTERWNDLVRR